MVLFLVGDCVRTNPDGALDSTLQGDFNTETLCVPASCEGKISLLASTAPHCTGGTVADSKLSMQRLAFSQPKQLRTNQ